MLPLAHVYVTTKAVGKSNPLLILGSFLPDIAMTSRNFIPHDKIHSSPQEFYEFIKKNYPKLLDLALGVLLHGVTNHGVDYYSDDTETGFALIEGRKIESDVARLLKIGDNHRVLILAHNFIEAGIDINLLAAYPQIMELYQSAFTVDMPAVADCLSDYLSLDQPSVLHEIKKFTDYFQPDKYSSVKNIAVKFGQPLIEIRFGKTIDPILIEKIIIRAVDITRDSTLPFLDRAVTGIKVDFNDFIAHPGI